MPKDRALKAKAEYRDHESKGKFGATDVQIDWEGEVLHYKKSIFWKKLAFKDVVAWRVHAEPGGKPDKFGRLKILHIIKLSTDKEMREFALPPDVFETWLYWVIRSLIKHSKAPMPEDRVSQGPLREKHKVKAITSQNVSEFDRIHHTFVNTLINLEGGGKLTVQWNGKFKGAGGTHLDFKDAKKLGSGGSGTMILKINKLLEPIKMGGSTEPVAVKMSGTTTWEIDSKQKDAITDMIKEARVLAALGKHMNIVALVDTAVFEDRFCLFLEMGSGDLAHRKNETPALTRGQVLKYAMDILTGIDHMHQRRVYHLDMKPENVILCKGDVAKIIDFGLARSATFQAKEERFKAPGNWTKSGTDGYIGPEAWDWGSKAITSEDDLAKRDSFAVGLTIINGLLVPFLNLEEVAKKVKVNPNDRFPFPGEQQKEVLERINFWKKNLLKNETTREVLRQKALLALAEGACHLIDENPKIRWTVGQALEFLKADRKQLRHEHTSNRNDVLTTKKEYNYLRDQLKKSRD